MNRRTFLAGLTTAAVGGSALLASGAYSQVESQRNVRIETVGDEDAYLKLVYGDTRVDCEGEIGLVTLANQLKHPLTDVEVTYEAPGSGIEFGELTVPGTLGTGESGTVSVPVECGPGGTATETVRFTVTVRGSDSTVQARDREIEVTCSCSGGPDEFDATGISFVALCPSGSDPVRVTELEVTHVTERTEGVEEPTGVRWPVLPAASVRARRVSLLSTRTPIRTQSARADRQ
jgi:hypothetical protein